MQARSFHHHGSRFTTLTIAMVTAGATMLLTPAYAAGGTLVAAAPLAQATGTPAADTPFTADKLASLLPATVYFQGRTAPLQLRNAAGTAFHGDQIFWAALVDTSGYSSSVQERYQFYLVSEAPLRVGDVALPAGAYGAGFLGDHFLVMDLGGHTLAQGPLHTDGEMKRPRPLQLLPGDAGGMKLYLGRHWVSVHAGEPK